MTNNVIQEELLVVEKREEIHDKNEYNMNVKHDLIEYDKCPKQKLST